MTPVGVHSEITVREDSVSSINARIRPWLYLWRSKGWDEEVGQNLDTDVFKRLPSFGAVGTGIESLYERCDATHGFVSI